MTLPIFGDHLVIDSFRGDYKFLSNFYIGKPIEYAGPDRRDREYWDTARYPVETKATYMTAEHLYQAFKSCFGPEFRKIVNAKSPGLAKKTGNRCQLRHDWNTYKLTAMKHTIAAKFAEPDLRKRLLATGNTVLVEGNWWNDKFWGQVNGKGENHLGKILMAERAKG